MKLIPASSAAWMIRIDSSWSGLPQAPNIIAPRQKPLTWTPVRPRGRKSMAAVFPGRGLVTGGSCSCPIERGTARRCGVDERNRADDVGRARVHACRIADDQKGTTMNTPSADSGYPAALDVDYPDRPLNRLTTFFRPFVIIPIAIVLSVVSGATQVYRGGSAGSHATVVAIGAGGVLVAGPLLMILF